MNGDQQLGDLAVSNDDEYWVLRYYAGDPGVDAIDLTNDASIRYGLVAKDLRERGLLMSDAPMPRLSPEGWTVLRTAIAARKQHP